MKVNVSFYLKFRTQTSNEVDFVAIQTKPWGLEDNLTLY